MHRALAAMLSAGVLLAVAAAAPRAAGGEESPLARAHEAMRRGEKAAALRAFEAAIERVPLLADHALFHASRLARERGERERARRLLDRLLSEHPDSVWRPEASVDRAELALGDGAPGKALSVLGAAGAVRRWPSELRARATLARARALAALGRSREAFAAIHGIAGTPPVAEAARRLRESLAALGPRRLALEPGELALSEARARRREGRLDEARAALAPWAARPGRHRAEALLELARLDSRRDAERAVERYREVERIEGRSSIAATALFERARLEWNRDHDAEAEAAFARFLERFPGDRRATEARYARARIAEARGDLRLAEARFEELRRRAGDPGVSGEAAWRAGFARLLAGDPEGALRRFEGLPAGPRGRYWRARALAADGESARASASHLTLLARDPLHYLAWWAERALGRDPLAALGGGAGSEGDSSGAAPKGAVRPVPARAARGCDASPPRPRLSRAADLHRRRGDALLALRLAEEAAREYRAAEAIAGASFFLADRYRRAGAFAAEIRAATRLPASEPRTECHLFPRAHEDVFSTAARRSGIDASLLRAVARRESLFDPRARSSAGAIGLMQLLPRTARRVAGRAVSADELERPEVNVGLGARYLRTLLSRFGGRLVLAIAAYNAGPEAVERWLERAGSRPGDEFVELIGYRETRRYVKAVLEAYRHYRALDGGGDVSLRLY